MSQGLKLSREVSERAQDDVDTTLGETVGNWRWGPQQCSCEEGEGAWRL